MGESQASAVGKSPSALVDMSVDAPANELPTVILFPGIGGEDSLWDPFRHALQIELLSYFDWTEMVAPDADLAAQVEQLKLQIEERFPLGKLRFLGYSIGGPLAFACAKAFQAEGRPVGCLALLDSRATTDAIVLSRKDRLRVRIDNLKTLAVRSGIASVAAKIATKDATRPLLRKAAAIRDAKLPFGLHRFVHDKIRMQMMLRLYFSWWRKVTASPIQLATPTYLFRSQEHDSQERQDLGWSDYCSDVTVVPVSGHHMTMLDPGIVEPLCAQLAELMRRI